MSGKKLVKEVKNLRMLGVRFTKRRRVKINNLLKK
jgi:hypothetical protein